MDNQRLLLWAALGFILLQIWTSWQIDYGPRPQPNATQTANDNAQGGNTQENGQTVNNTAGLIDQSESNGGATDLPTPATTTAANNAQPGTSLPSENEPAAEQQGTQISVVTDTMKVLIGTKGGDINLSLIHI